MAGVVVGAAFAIGLVAFNLWAGQTPTPVSGMVKRLIAQRHEPHLSAPVLTDALFDTASVLLKHAAIGVGAVWPPALASAARVGVAALAVAAWVRGWWRPGPWGMTWMVALAAHVLSLRLWLSGYHLDTMWYFMPQHLSAAVLAGVLCARWQRALGHGRLRRRWPPLVGLSKTVLLALALCLPIPQDSLGSVRLAAGRWLAEHVNPEERIAAWNAGELSYFSQRTVINLDGLVNSRSYYERLRTGGGATAAYLDEQGVDWVTDYAKGVDNARRRYWGVLDPNDWLLVKRFGERRETAQQILRRATSVPGVTQLSGAKEQQPQSSAHSKIDRPASLSGHDG